MISPPAQCVPSHAWHSHEGAFGCASDFLAAHLGACFSYRSFSPSSVQNQTQMQTTWAAQDVWTHPLCATDMPWYNAISCMLNEHEIFKKKMPEGFTVEVSKLQSRRRELIQLDSVKHRRICAQSPANPFHGPKASLVKHSLWLLLGVSSVMSVHNAFVSQAQLDQNTDRPVMHSTCHVLTRTNSCQGQQNLCVVNSAPVCLLSVLKCMTHLLWKTPAVANSSLQNWNLHPRAKEQHLPSRSCWVDNIKRWST